MTEANYAFIKNNVVVNVAVFDNPSDELLATFKDNNDVDSIILATEKTAINGTYDGINFILPSPFPSWIKNEETNDWEPPIPYPVNADGGYEHYTWDEGTTSWLLSLPSE